MADDLAFRTTMNFAYGEPADLAPGVTRLVANNPGPFTFKGTNTYIVGSRSLAVIDPGPSDAAHLAAILAAAGGRPITDIVITHTHRDHTDGLAALQAATGARTVGYGRSVAREGTVRTSPSGSEFIDRAFVPDLRLTDGETVRGEDWALTALFTPGHAPDHLCFALEGTPILFSGDHVMAWNTSVVAPPEGNMADYLASLERLLTRDHGVYLPGHGGRLEQPQRMVRAFIVHRQMREQSILNAVRDGRGAIPEIVATVYAGLDPRLVPAASLSVLAHLEHLIARHLASSDGPPGLQARFSAASASPS